MKCTQHGLLVNPKYRNELNCNKQQQIAISIILLTIDTLLFVIIGVRSMNILSLEPYLFNPLQQITQKILHVINKYKQSTKEHTCIEIEYKFAELTQFCQSYYAPYIKQLIKNMPEKDQKTIMQLTGYYVMEQNRRHYETLKNLSKTNMILLNNLGGGVYKLEGGFNQLEHRRFYQMKEFMLNLCLQNQRMGTSPHNFYIGIRNIAENKEFKLINSAEMRLDVNIRHGENEGRYSYETGKGWTRTRKENLLGQDLDVLIAERPFRLAAKLEQEVVVEDALVAEILSSSLKQGFLRVKKALKVVKNEEVQYAFSEIYQPTPERRNQLMEDLKELLNWNTNLDEFVKDRFVEFYMFSGTPEQERTVRKFEIEAQFTQKGLQKMHAFIKSKNFNFKDLQRQIELNFMDMNALYYTAHYVKKQESKVLEEFKKQHQTIESKSFPECRLQNEIGSYMHDLIQDYIFLNKTHGNSNHH